MKRLAALLAVVGLLALGYCAFEFGRARLFQAREAPRFNSPQRQLPSLASPAPAVLPYPKTGSPVALLTIPRLALSTLVVEGTGRPELKLGPGHIPGTSLPGHGGTSR